MEAKAVVSNQAGLNEKLDEVVSRHLRHTFKKPYAEHSLAAFAELEQWLAKHSAKPLVLDSCCGVGESTAVLAQRHPEAVVVGVDKSAHRLGKHAHYASAQDNYLVLRADLNDLWRLLVEHGLKPSHHYLLYPNPWPKAAHLGRRWHGGPSFAALLALGGQLEVRSNWQLYVLEFARALQLAGIESQQAEVTLAPITPFERKYMQAGQPCWQLKADLNLA
ncbi:tRNA (guanine(46)-N(7))-methyltransferase TrmB [Gallaecimonas mangrovi]|uniref:tRNA (guanine(46)-N(7))-methyltransferase TrmB n=1 Tax=Gallaecimonas mangrovi TaxID=2291597 RepID=UPI000E20BEDD|nr:SAM-dependent methyltransferase [Gallaecimonas mangrovi]